MLVHRHFESLLEHVPLKYLPKDYGGESPPLIELHGMYIIRETRLVRPRLVFFSFETKLTKSRAKCLQRLGVKKSSTISRISERAWPNTELRTKVNRPEAAHTVRTAVAIRRETLIILFGNVETNFIH